MTRKYRRCSSSPYFKRAISFCRLPSGDILGNLALVQYNFTGEGHLFVLNCHGNSQKRKIPYQQTNESTKYKLKSNLQQHLTKEAFQKTTRELGGTKNAQSAGVAPRNRKQAYNMKQQTVGCARQSSTNDVLGSLLAMENKEWWCDGQTTFIRSIQTHPNPLFIVLGFSTQFENLKA